MHKVLSTVFDSHSLWMCVVELTIRIALGKSCLSKLAQRIQITRNGTWNWTRCAIVPFTLLIYLLAHLRGSTMEVQTPDNPTEWQIGQTTFRSLDDAFIRISTFSHFVRGRSY